MPPSSIDVEAFSRALLELPSAQAVDADDAESLRFSPDQVLQRVEGHGDLMAPVLELVQKLPALR